MGVNWLGGQFCNENFRQGKLAEIERQYAIAAGNLALASCPETFAAVESKVKELAALKSQLTGEINSLVSFGAAPNSQHESVDAAIALLDQLPSLADDPDNLGSIGRRFRQINLQVFLNFRAVRKKKRTVNQLSGGVLTIGTAQPPVQKYQGPTGRRALQSWQKEKKKNPAADAAGLDSTPDSAQTAKSLGNVSRDDAHRFEPMEVLAATCVRDYPVDRPPQLQFLARLVNDPSES